MSAISTRPESAIIQVSDINTEVNCEPRIQDLRLAEILGFERPRNIRQIIKRQKVALERFGELVCCTVKQTPKGGRPGREYYLNEKQALYLCTKSEAEHAIELTIQMVEVFHQVRRGQSPTRQAPDHDQFDPAAYAQEAIRCGVQVTEITPTVLILEGDRENCLAFEKTDQARAYERACNEAPQARLIDYLRSLAYRRSICEEIATLDDRKRELKAHLEAQLCHP